MSSNPPQPVQQAVAPPDLTRSYAEWFDWAGQQFKDEHAAHVATSAAIATLRTGADPAAAVAAGRQAGSAPDAAALPLTVDTPTQAYAAWFVWARRKVGLDPQRAHLAAKAGRDAQAAGAPVRAAQSDALAAAGVSQAPIAGGLSWRDPALLAIAFGIVCLVVPFVFNWYFIILPFLGLTWSIRALKQSRLALAVTAIVINGFACLLTAALFFHLL
jgi:hypothetical protein